MKKVLVSDEGIDMIKDRDKVIGVKPFGESPSVEANLNTCSSKKTQPSDDVLIFNKKLCLVSGDSDGLHFFINNTWQDIENTKNRYGYLGVVGDIDNDGNPSMVYIYRKPNSNGKVIVAERKRINGVWSNEEIWNEEDYFYNGLFYNSGEFFTPNNGMWYIRPDFIDEYGTWQSNSYPPLWVLPASNMHDINVIFYRVGGGKTGDEEPVWNIGLCMEEDFYFVDHYYYDYVNKGHPHTWDKGIRWYQFQKELREWGEGNYYLLGEFIKLSDGRVVRVTNLKIWNPRCEAITVPEDLGEERNGVYETRLMNFYSGPFYLVQFMDCPEFETNKEYRKGDRVKVRKGDGYCYYYCTKEGISGEYPSMSEECLCSFISGETEWHRCGSRAISFCNETYPAEYKFYSFSPIYAVKESNGALYKVIGFKSYTDEEPSEEGWYDAGNSYRLVFFYFFNNDLNDKTLIAYVYDGDRGDIRYLEDYAKSNVGLKVKIRTLQGIKELNYSGISSDYQEFNFEVEDINWSVHHLYDPTFLPFYNHNCHLYYEVDVPYPASLDVDFTPILNKERYWYPDQEDERIFYQILNNDKLLIFKMKISEGDEDKLHNILYKTGEKQTLNFESTWDIYGVDNDGQHCYMSYYIYDENGFPVDKLIKLNKNGVAFNIDLPMAENGKDVLNRNPCVDENYLYLLNYLITGTGYPPIGRTRVYTMNKENGEIIATTEIYDENSGKIAEYLLKSTLSEFRIVYQDIFDGNFYIDCELRNKGFFPFFIRLCLLNTLNIGLRER